MKNHPETDHCGFDRNASISEDCYVCTCGYVDRETPNPRPSQLTEQVRGAIAAGPALLPPTHPEAIKYGKKRETAREFAERVALLAISDFSPRPEGLGLQAAQGAFRCAEQALGLLQECDEAFSNAEVDAALVKAFGHDGASVFRERVRRALVSPLAEYCNACKKTVAKPCMLVEECPHYADGDMNSSIMERK